MFFHAVSDARNDPCYPCSWPVAFVWTLWHWKFVKALYKDEVKVIHG